MLDRKADATMRVAVLVPTSVVPMPAVPMTVVMLVVLLRDAVLIKVAVPTRAAMSAADQKPVAIRDAVLVLDPTSVVLMLGAMPDVRPRDAARKARSRDDRHSKACVLRSTCWTETMMAKSAATKS